MALRGNFIGEDGYGKRARRRLLSLFLRDRKATTAIEFTVLAIPFSLLVFAILESCISFGAQQLITNATDDIARGFRTGQLRAADYKGDETKLHKLICGKIDFIVDDSCPGLVFDLRSFDTFEEAAKVRTKIKDNDLDTSDFKVDPGAALTKNMLRIYYRWPVMTDFMRKSMSNIKGGKTLLFATATWQNEPFDD